MQKKIVFANLDTQFLTMYSESGEEIVIAQGDPRIRKIVEAVFPAIDSKGYYILRDEDLSDANNYHEAEKSLGGVVKFFRMAKAKLAEIVDKFTVDLSPKAAGTKPEVEVQSAYANGNDQLLVGTKTTNSDGSVSELVDNGDGSLGVLTTGIPVGEPVLFDPTLKIPIPEPKSNASLNSALSEIMENATPVGSLAYTTAGPMTADETIVAVVDGETVIEGVEQIEHQLMSIAQKLGSATGVSNFFRRLATVERKHSIADLLKFMEKGELPIAGDGTVIVYKLLNRHGQGDSMYFTDVHSGNVKQKIGSKVFMSEELVDPNRNNECSNGLHIARRDYLRSFSGNACMLCKLAPEDVVAVPHGDARKLRAKGYFIVAELSDQDRSRVMRNEPMQDNVLLGNVAAGNHTEVLETVEITKASGGGLKITSLQKPKVDIVLDSDKKSSSLDSLTAQEGVTVDARAIALGTHKAEPETLMAAVVPEPVLQSAVVPNSSKRPIDVLVQAYLDAAGNLVQQVKAAKALLDFKKASKKSWTALGVKIEVWEKATQLVVDSQAPVAPLEKPVASAVEKPAVNQVQKPTMSRIQQLVCDFSDAKSGSRTEYYAALAVIKYGKDSKKSLEKIGVPTAVITKVKKVADKGEPAQQPVVKALSPKKVPAVKAKSVSVKPEKVKPIVDKTKAKLSQGDRARELYAVFKMSNTKSNAQALLDFKKSAKKGWETLGLSEQIGADVVKAAK